MKLSNLVDDIPADVKLFVKGLVASIFNALVIFAFSYFANPGNYSRDGFSSLWGGALGAVIAGSTLYFKKSPVPEWKFDKAVENGEPPPDRRKNP